MKVFIVDDSAVVRERLLGLLSEAADVQVIGEAEGCQEASSDIRKLKPDAVILDIRMPDGSGIDVLKVIKKMKTPPMVIMFTNYPYPQYRKKCIEAGADFFFDKSTEFQKVTELLKQMAADMELQDYPEKKVAIGRERPG